MGLKLNFLGRNVFAGMAVILLCLGTTPASGQPSERGFAGGSESTLSELAALAHTGGVVESPSALTRIIGGENALIVDFPWQVALLRAPGNNAYYQQFCGGSIIDRWWIVTAAHCVEDLSSKEIYVTYGVEYLAIGPVSRQAVRAIVEHPDYNPQTAANDVALLKLRTPLSYSSSVAAVGLSYEEQIGFDGVITGWGNMSTSGYSYPQQLKAAVVSHVSDVDCFDAYGAEFESASMVCAGHPLFQFDSCDGDSGGPLVTLVSGEWTLTGITSWGYGCAQSPYPGVYAKVAAFETWIRSTTGVLANYRETKTPIVSGNAVLGQTLSAGFGPAAYWDPVPDRYAYQWLANGMPIKRATGSTYVPGKKDVGKRISVRVAGVKSGYVTATETSSSTDVVLTGLPYTSTETPTVSGDAVLGLTLTAAVADWDPVPDRYAYQWLANGMPIKRATGSTYVPGKKDVGKRISVRVAGVKSGYVTATETSSSTDVVLTGLPYTSTETPTVSGDAVLGLTLTAAVADWDPVPDRYAYQWLANGKPIKRATGSTYVPGKKDVGKRISVRVAGVKSGYVTATETSSSTDVVLTGLPYTSTETPTVSGDAVLGLTLTAAVADWDPVPDRYAYQWLANGKPIKRATGSTYVPGKKDVGKRISVRVAGVKSGYVTATETSSQTSVVTR